MGAELWFEVVEHVFTVFFHLELIFQIWLEGRRFYEEWLHWVDTVVVIANCANMFVLKPLAFQSLGNVAVLRLLRMAKLVRTLRIIRSMTVFSGLRVLVRGDRHLSA